MSNKLILILVDGIGADFFAQQCPLLPHMNNLANTGLLINRLAPETCANSLPGRASILTGQSAQIHGIYGNIIWDGHSFRYASPYDVNSTAITRMAQAHSLNVACIGYGMARREDCSLFHPPFWVRDYMIDALRQSPEHYGWQRTLEGEPDFLVGNSCVKSVQSRLIHQNAGSSGYEWSGQINDQILMDRIASLATVGETPDFILGEIAMPDYFFHKYGCNSEHGLWAAITADAMIGRLIAQLDASGQREQWNIAIMSDHGHMDVDQTLHPEYILPTGMPHACESSVLHVALKSEKETREVTARLAEWDVEPLDGSHLPESNPLIHAFLASNDRVFEKDTENTQQPDGVSHYISSHGFRFGHKADERFAIFAGPNIPNTTESFATAGQVTPTLARILKLPLNPFPASSLF